MVIDVLSTAERKRGHVQQTTFTRLAYGFDGGRVRRCVNLGELDLPELPDTGTEHAAASETSAGS
jgi:hypothetical protein